MAAGQTNTDRDSFAADERAHHVARWREQSAMVASRLKHGFQHQDLGQTILGRTRPDFVEEGLRSKRLGRSGQMFVAGCPKAKGLRGGKSKGAIGSLGPNKVLGLDEVYIEGNREMVSLIRIDLDYIFHSSHHVKAVLADLVAQHQLPCMPHLICGELAPAWIVQDGQRMHYPAAVHHPHLWVILPAAVNCKRSGRAKPKQLLLAVARGICKALIAWGADPNASILLVRGKNPLCPYLWAEALNNSHWPSLTEWAEWVDTRVGREQLSRIAAEAQSGAGKSASNEAFTAMQKEAYAVLRTAHVKGDEAYKLALSDGLPSLTDFLRDRMTPAHRARDSEPWQMDRIREAVVSYASSAWDPTRAAPSEKPRGSMRHLTDGMSQAEAQAASGQRSAALKAEKALQALVAAYRAVEATGEQPTQTAVSTLAGVRRETASRRWAAVLASVTNGV